MENNQNNSKKKKIAIAASSALVLCLAGTFAWNSISQRALNENKGENEPGGRIHDDFNRKTGNKDIYAENFGNMPIMVRIKLSEYLERDNVPLIDGTVKNDRSTWTPFVLNTNGGGQNEFLTTGLTGGDPATNLLNNVTDQYREYVGWTLGGEKVFLPTFNKNKNDLSTDASGDAIDQVFAELVGNGIIDFDKNQNAYFTQTQWDALTLEQQEDFGTPAKFWDVLKTFGQYANALGNGEQDIFTDGNSYSSEYLKNRLASLTQTDADGNITSVYDTVSMDNEHTAKYTLTQSQVPMSMSDWEALTDPADKVGNYWVIDEDGWAYWANYLAPSESTSLLLDQLTWNDEELKKSESWYYGIDVIGEFTSMEDEFSFDFSEHGAPSEKAAQLTEEVKEAAKNIITPPKQPWTAPENVGETFNWYNNDMQLVKIFEDGSMLIQTADVLKTDKPMGLHGNEFKNSTMAKEILPTWFESLNDKAKQEVQKVDVNSEYAILDEDGAQQAFLISHREGKDLITASGDSKVLWKDVSYALRTFNGKNTAYYMVRSLDGGIFSSGKEHEAFNYYRPAVIINPNNLVQP